LIFATFFIFTASFRLEVDSENFKEECIDGRGKRQESAGPYDL
jgi:hypothetical protein